MPAGFTVVAWSEDIPEQPVTYVVRAPNMASAIDIVVEKLDVPGNVTFSANRFFSDMLLDLAPGDAVLVKEFAA